MSMRSLKSWLMPSISQFFLSRERLIALRAKAEKKRIQQKRPHTLHFFHQADDPYSLLLAHALPNIAQRYRIEVQTHWVGPPADSAAPEREKLIHYSQLDALRLAKHHEISEQALQDITEDSALCTLLKVPAFSTDQARKAHVQASEILRKKWGHYSGATIYYEGEWYWGIDRLHHLEQRLEDLGAARSHSHSSKFLFPPDQYSNTSPVEAGQSIDFFFSFRSPYSAIAAPRVFQWAHEVGVSVNLRYLLPMVMRGLPVLPEKVRYISLDAAREAHVQGVPFGRINDPVGKPTERALALMPLAESLGLGQAYVKSFMHSVWAQGIDAGTDTGLQLICEHAKLPWAAAQEALASAQNDRLWRSVAEQNRQDLYAAGLWGVPSYQYQSTSAWGQDRFWVIEDALNHRARAQTH